jgi:hypothetical protein
LGGIKVNFNKIKNIEVMIYNDDMTLAKPLNVDEAGTGANGYHEIDYTGPGNDLITLYRKTGGIFDNTSYDTITATGGFRGILNITLFE